MNQWKHSFIQNVHYVSGPLLDIRDKAKHKVGTIPDLKEQTSHSSYSIVDYNCDRCCRGKVQNAMKVYHRETGQ